MWRRAYYPQGRGSSIPGSKGGLGSADDVAAVGRTVASADMETNPTLWRRLRRPVLVRLRRTAPASLRRPGAALIATAGLLATGLAVPVSAAASAPDPVPGVTPTSVLIGSDQPLTGVSAPGYGRIGPASAAFFDYVNAHGHVYGRSINYTFLDDAF